MNFTARTLVVAVLAAGLALPTQVAVSAAPPMTAPTHVSAASHANAVLEALRPSLKAGARDSFAIRGTSTDPDGSVHVRYDRFLDGLPVLGGDLVLHLTPAGSRRGVSVEHTAGLNLSARPRVGPDAAVAAARARAEQLGVGVANAAGSLSIDALSDGPPALVWDVVADGTKADGTPSRLHVLVDALTGLPRNAFDSIQSAVGRSLYSGTVSLNTTKNPQSGQYEMTDPNRGGATATDLLGDTNGQGRVFTDDDNTWGDGTIGDRATAAVDASYGAARAYDYYQDVLGRPGVFGNGSGVRSRVHYGMNVQNAFWDGTQMSYGDGASGQRPLVSLDIAGHEMTHGVTQNSAGLVYSGESGGLNEATSDIFGTMIEFYAHNAVDPGDYRLGEQLGSPRRYMDTPSRDGSSRDCYSKGLGKLDVHSSSGPANHLFYLLAEGSGRKTINGVEHSSTTCNGSSMVGVGRTAASRIWYRALTVYMTSSTNYTSARVAAVQAAADLYGGSSSQCEAVIRAFDAINVPGQGCVSPLVDPAGPDVTTTRISTRDGLTGSGSNPALTPDGRYVVFASHATSLGADGIHDQVFRSDLQTGELRLVSATRAGAPGNGSSSQPVITPDGRWVAFASTSSNLSRDADVTADIFLRDLAGGPGTELVSITRDGSPATQASVYPSISDDGTKISFQSSASNLVAGDTNDGADVFLRDRTAMRTTRVSIVTHPVGPTNYVGSNQFFHAEASQQALSGDGRFVTFTGHWGGGGLASAPCTGTYEYIQPYLYDTATSDPAVSGSVPALARPEEFGCGARPAIAGSGSVVGFPDQSNGFALANVGTRSVIHHPLGNGPVRLLSIDATGGRVVVSSSSTDLDTSDTNGLDDAYLVDTATGQAVLASRRSDDTPIHQTGVEEVSSPAVDGSLVFTTSASDVVAGDYNAEPDVFRFGSPAGARVPRPALAGGVGIALTDGEHAEACTNGFGVERHGVRYFLTAHHCIDGTNGLHLGRPATVTSRYWLNGAPGVRQSDPILTCSPSGDICLEPSHAGDYEQDLLAWRPNGPVVTNRVWTGSRFEAVIAGVAKDSQGDREGDQVCTFGVTSQAERCGKITDTTPVAGEQGIRRLALPSLPGDSGSPVYTRVPGGLKIEGVVVASNGQETDIVTLAKIKSSLGVALLTTY